MASCQGPHLCCRPSSASTTRQPWRHARSGAPPEAPISADNQGATTIQTNLIDDIGAAIGTTATLRLLALFGGTRLYVPETIEADHVIVRALGLEAALRLSAAFGREQLDLAGAEDFHRLRRVRRVAGLLRAGTGARDVADLVGVSTKQVGRCRAEAEAIGLLPMVFSTP
ncbi:hypothetical protein [Aromatoleum anaerobium]|uniref:Mor transcription activator domain-containing protein n=1 Tax=Aromatoleum anaerobium TaxID=182180 RepID=A0ABX1PSD5_9RHOO|nr:hypothetical protein [Aromatoleum anaerobium]MCK0508466.1 hypothetical protein [Aromatoleum anaerobium]